MKIALYIEDGLEQVVFTPESDTEKGILAKLHDASREMSIKRGSFYQCRGGWVRHTFGQIGDSFSGYRDSDDDSTMIVLRPVKAPAVNSPEAFAEQGE